MTLSARLRLQHFNFIVAVAKKNKALHKQVLSIYRRVKLTVTFPV